MISEAHAIRTGRFTLISSQDFIALQKLYWAYRMGHPLICGVWVNNFFFVSDVFIWRFTLIFNQEELFKSFVVVTEILLFLINFLFRCSTINSISLMCFKLEFILLSPQVVSWPNCTPDIHSFLEKMKSSNWRALWRYWVFRQRIWSIRQPENDCSSMLVAVHAV